MTKRKERWHLFHWMAGYYQGYRPDMPAGQGWTAEDDMAQWRRDSHARIHVDQPGLFIADSGSHRDNLVIWVKL